MEILNQVKVIIEVIRMSCNGIKGCPKLNVASCIIASKAHIYINAHDARVVDI